MVTITDTGLRHTVWETVYDLLDAANLCSSLATVTASFIDDNTHFPQVVINPIEKNTNSFTIDTTRTTSTKELVITIDLFTKKGEQIDLLLDEIEQVLLNNHISGLTIQSLDNMSGDGRDVNGNKIHVNTLSVTYLRR